MLHIRYWKCFILTNVLLMLVVFLHAQQNNKSITGIVLTKDSIPVTASVGLVLQKKITHTNHNGYFSILYSKTITDTLEISYLGNVLKRIPLHLENGEGQSLGVVLINYDQRTLEEVFISSDRMKNNDFEPVASATRINTPAHDLPQSINILTAENIKDRMEISLRETMDEVAGINYYSGYDEYSIRGLKAENAKMINGLRGFNSTYTSNLLSNIEKIEVLKGPVAALYGNGDPGGTVNLVTKKPLNFNKSELTILGGSWDHKRFLGDFNRPLNQLKTISFRLNLLYDQSKSYRDLIYNKSYQVAPSFSFKPNEKLTMNVDVSYSSIDGMIDRGQPSLRNPYPLNLTSINLGASQKGDFLEEKTLASTLWTHYQLNKKWSFHLGYLNYVTFQEAAGHGVHSYVNNDSVNLYYSKWEYTSNTNNINPYVQYNIKQGKLSHQLIAGYDLIKTKADPEQEYFDDVLRYTKGSGVVGGFNLKHPNYFTRNISLYQTSSYATDAAKVEPAIFTTQGAYLQDQIKVSRWIVLLGLRKESYEAEEDENDTGEETVISELMPKVGVTYKMNNSSNLFFNYSKGFDPFEVSASTQIFKDPFKPVTSQLFEVGYKTAFFDEKLTSSFSVYKIKLQNVAVNANDLTIPNLFVQRGEHSSFGFESEWNGNPVPNFYMNLTYAYNIAKITKSIIPDEVGKFVENAPVNSSSSWLRYQLNKGVLKNVGFVLGHTQVSKRYLIQREIILPGYITIQSGLRYSMQKWNIMLNVNNIGNKKYWVGGYNAISKWPGAPRNFNLQLTFKL
jgi:iron complex outermembrane recepter protein